MSNGNVIENRIRALTRRAQMTDFQRGVLDEQLFQDERIEDLETQEFQRQGLGGGITLIDEQKPTGASLTFSSIPADFRQLRIVWTAHRDGSTDGETIEMQFNGDTGARYMWIRHNSVAGSGPAADAHGLSDSAGFDNEFPFGEVATDHPGFDAAHSGFGIVDIPFYAEIDFYTSILATAGVHVDSVTGMRHTSFSGTWEDTAVVTSIFIDGAGANNFESGSTFSLYGIG